jgi:hypothetical protein
MRISLGFHRPIRTHFARIGTTHRIRKPAPPNSTDRR